ncbi:hypothetical protein [Pontibacillus marinus]|nr:hypothetical protein [Pontibacillus marinus]
MMMFWVRMILIGAFSATSLSLMLFQGIEIYHSFLDFFNHRQS